MGIGGWSSKKGGDKDKDKDQDKDKGKGKRAASKSTSPPAPQPQRTNTGGSSTSNAATSLPSGMAGLLRRPSPPKTTTLPVATPQPKRKRTNVAKQIRKVFSTPRQAMGKAPNNELVWYCCSCLIKLYPIGDDKPPEYNRYGQEPNNLNRCWHVFGDGVLNYDPATVTPKYVCLHIRCEGCIEWPAEETPGPHQFMKLYKTAISEVPWVKGPWGNFARAVALRYFTDIVRTGKTRTFPDWWCCKCYEKYPAKNWNRVVQIHWCTKKIKNKECRHKPCRHCFLVQPTEESREMHQLLLKEKEEARRPSSKSPQPQNYVY